MRSLLVDGKTAGNGAVSGFRLSSETNAINGSFCIYTGDFGVDMSKVKTAEPDTSAKICGSRGRVEFFPGSGEKKSEGHHKDTGTVLRFFSIEDGRTVEVYRYAENEGARKLYVKVTRPGKTGIRINFTADIYSFEGLQIRRQKVLFKAAAGDIYLLNRNINSNTKSITIIPEVIPRGEVGGGGSGRRYTYRRKLYYTGK